MSKNKRIGSRERRRQKRIKRGLPETEPQPPSSLTGAELDALVDFILHGPGGP